MSTIAEAGTLERAAAQAAIVRLVAGVIGQQRTFRARIVQALGDEACDGMWIHLINDAAGTAALAAARPECQATFSVERARFEFTAAVVKREPHFWIDDRMMYDALLLSPPRNLRRIEQRRCERVPVGDHSGVRGQLYWGAPEPANPATKLKTRQPPIAATLRDLSLMGAGFICPTTRQLLIAKPEAPMTCLIQFGGESMTLSASLAQVSEISNRTLRVGVSFEAQAAQLQENRSGLERALAELQRQQSLRRPRR